MEQPPSPPPPQLETRSRSFGAPAPQLSQRAPSSSSSVSARAASRAQHGLFMATPWADADAARVASRLQGAVADPTSVFGFNGHGSSIIDLQVDMNLVSGGRHFVGVSAIVRVTLRDGTAHEDVGYGHASAASPEEKGAAVRKARIAAVDEARSRALSRFGRVAAEEKGRQQQRVQEQPLPKPRPQPVPGMIANQMAAAQKNKRPAPPQAAVAQRPAKRPAPAPAPEPPQLTPAPPAEEWDDIDDSALLAAAAANY